MRHALHIVVAIVMWCLFGYYWQVVLRRDVDASTLRALTILGLVIVSGLLVTLFWVRHNLRLARRFGDRRRRTPIFEAPLLERDTIGRPIDHPGLAALRRARVIDVAADASTKTYTVATDREVG